MKFIHYVSGEECTPCGIPEYHLPEGSRTTDPEEVTCPKDRAHLIQTGALEEESSAAKVQRKPTMMTESPPCELFARPRMSLT